MKAVILAGGLGTRLSEETGVRPKPMVEIGGHPILWHLMKVYASHGINEFVICCGYKGYMIKEFFSNYFLHTSDVTFDLASNQMHVHERKAEPWKVTLVDTGESTATGGRLKRVATHLQGEDAFCFTYGDGLADVDVGASVAFHRSHGRLLTVTAVQPPGRFGALQVDQARVLRFQEKPVGDGGWINGGFFVVSSGALGYIAGDSTSWEGDAMVKLAAEDQVRAYFHHGFWQPMDTLREKNHLEELYATKRAPWVKW